MSDMRAKFKVDQIYKNEGKLVMSPVSCGSEENDKFFQYTPCGSLEISTINEEALKGFEEGGEYYLDFTKAN